MKLNAAAIRLSATDLSNHLACRHVTTLDLQVARGEKKEPAWAAPDLAVIQELGKQHEAAYLDYLAKQGIAVTNLADIKSETTLVEETLRLMSQGAEIIAQGALTDGKWFGRPDVLTRVTKSSPNWPWSYEVADTKLARDTKAATILQISLYSELLGKAQGCEPETMWVIPPGNDFKGEPYRVAEYAAYFRYVKARLERVAQDDAATTTTYPEPVPHCDVCRWFRQCDDQRHADDHLSLVAGIRRQQRNQLEDWDRKTVARLAEMSIPVKKKPAHGSRKSMEQIREQARVQVESRTEPTPVYERLEVKPEIGLCRLPEPSPLDLFVDLEGDPFAGKLDAGGGQEYLFGFVSSDDSGTPPYENRWALTAEAEKAGFEWLVDEVMRR